MPSGGWRGGGRTKGSKNRKPPRDVVKQVRWTADEWAEVERLAKEAGMKPSVFVRRMTLG